VLEGLGGLDQWPDKVRLMQENWIGKSQGLQFRFRLAERLDSIDDVEVFTTRPDTIFGASFVAIAAGHPIARAAAATDPAAAEFIAECQRGGTSLAEIEAAEKKGFKTDLEVVHPLDPDWRLPVYIANFVLMDYGTGAIFGVPGHDQRDFEFASKYGLPIKRVVAASAGLASEPIGAEAEGGDGVAVNSQFLDGLTTEQATADIIRRAEQAGWGKGTVAWRLRDWGVSRQRYWGTPIPIIHCAHCGEVPVPEADLPVVLPEDCVPDGSGNPLNRREDFLNVACPSCNAPARRETDTMDTFVDSSWYFMRYTSPGAATMIDERDRYWMPMDQYIGGITHAILHLLYARFWTKVMRDFGMVAYNEPFTRLLTQGMVLAQAFYRRNDKGGLEYVPPSDVDVVRDANGTITGGMSKIDGQPVDYDGLGTMSKSKLNGVDPQDMIDRYGADAARLFVMFASPPEHTIEWSDTGVDGAHRFLKRLWNHAQTQRDVVAAADGAFDWRDAAETVRAARRDIHLALKQADYDYERIQYNTVVSAGMKMLNTLEDVPAGAPGAAALAREGLSIVLRVLYPVVPHTTWVLWRELRFTDAYGDLVDAPWPAVDESALVRDEIELVLQVNGKLRGKQVVPAGADRSVIEAAARGAPEVARHGGDGGIRKVIVVPGRLVNVVV
jgi:leucyl-tRNA synthetase